MKSFAFLFLLAFSLAACENRLLGSHQPTSKEARSELAERGIQYSLDSFFESAKGEDITTVRLFVYTGIDLNARNNVGATVLMYAAEGGNVEVVRFLVENGANINANDDDSLTILMYAARGGSIEVVRFLVENGANIHTKNNVGETVLMYAAEGGSIEVVRFLVENGADIHAEADNGTTAVTVAAEGGNVEVVSFLGEVGEAVGLTGEAVGEAGATVLCLLTFFLVCLYQRWVLAHRHRAPSYIGAVNRTPCSDGGESSCLG